MAQVNLTRNPQDAITAYSDPRSLVTSYVRDGFGETIRETSPDTGITDFSYDPRGLVTQVTDARLVVASFTYDSAGRVLTRSFPAAPAENVTYTYDAITGGNKGPATERGFFLPAHPLAGCLFVLLYGRAWTMPEPRTIRDRFPGPWQVQNIPEASR